MFKKNHLDITSLINDIAHLRENLHTESPTSQQLSLTSKDANMQQLIEEVNLLLEDLQEKHKKLYVKHEVVTELNEIGTWDLEITKGVPANTNSYNDIFRRELGYQDEKDFPNVFESWYNTVAPEEVERVMKAFDEHFSSSSQKSYNIEFKSVKKDGSIEWFHAKAETLRDELGEASRNIGTLTNIHENKMNTLRIQNLLSRLDLIEKSLAFSVSTVEGAWGMSLTPDAEFHEGWFSPQFKRLLGYEENELEPVIESWMNLIISNEREAIRKRFMNEIFHNMKTTDFEMTFQMELKDRTTRWFTMLIKVLRNHHGIPTLVSGVLRDIHPEIERQEYDTQIQEEMSNFTLSLQDVAKNIKVVSDSATDIATEHEVTAKASDEAQTNIESTKAITELIRNISRQTNLLGLNASIEAARAGEHGTGFSIVAQEVQKLASHTSDAVGQIEEILSEINTSVESIIKSITHMGGKVQSQAIITDEINRATENINGMSDRLLRLIEQL